MRRFLIFFMVVGLILGSFATAEAKKKKKKIKPKPEPTQVVQVVRFERTVEASYVGAQPAYEYRAACIPSAGCVTLDTHANETSLTANVMDAHGRPVSVWVVDASETRDGLNGPDQTYGAFCGKTTEPIRVEPGKTLELWIGGEWHPNRWVVGWSCPQPGVSTSGTVSVTLSGYRTA